MSGPWEDYGGASDGPWSDYAAEKPKPTKAEKKRAKRSGWDEAAGFMANVNRGLGIGDELAAGAQTAKNALTGKIKFDPGKPMLSALADDFQQSMAGQREIEDDFAERRPLVAAGGRGVGNALTVAAPAGPGAQAFAGGGRAMNALRGATVAGTTGAVYAAADRGSAEERIAAAGGAARDPVVLGLGAGVGAAATRGRPKAEKASAPTLDELTTQKQAAYKAVDESGTAYTSKQFGDLTKDMARALDAEGFHAGLHPKTAQMMERLGQSIRGKKGYAPTLSELDKLRQQIGRDVSGSPDKGERRMGEIMRGKIDEFIAAAGDSEQIVRARDLNTRVEKLRSLDNLDEAAADRAAATGSGGNINNATRQNVIRFKNNTANLTPAEQAAAQRVIDGTPTGNALRQVGKLSPEGNGLMLGGHLLASGATGGASNVAAGAGFVAKRVSDALTQRNVQALRDLIASGGEAAATVSRALDDPQYAELRAQLANDLAVQAGVQGSSRRGAVEVWFPDHPERGVGVSNR